MRRLLPGILIGLALGGTAAWTLAIPVTFPTRAKAKVVGIVDDVGNVLFGSTPGKVEVTNFPPPTAAARVVMLFDGDLNNDGGMSGVCTGTDVLSTATIAMGKATRLTIHGVTDGPQSQNQQFGDCYFGTEPWSDWSPTTARVPANMNGVVRQVGLASQVTGPVLGPYFGCRNVLGCGHMRLVAYLSD